MALLSHERDSPRVAALSPLASVALDSFEGIRHKRAGRLSLPLPPRPIGRPRKASLPGTFGQNTPDPPIVSSIFSFNMPESPRHAITGRQQEPCVLEVEGGQKKRRSSAPIVPLASGAKSASTPMLEIRHASSEVDQMANGSDGRSGRMRSHSLQPTSARGHLQSEKLCASACSPSQSNTMARRPRRASSESRGLSFSEAIGFTSPKDELPSASMYLMEQCTRQVAAVVTLQRIIRQKLRRIGSRRVRRRVAEWSNKRALCLNDRAIAAGAAELVNYSKEMMLRRVALRTDKTVLASLKHAWAVCSNASGSKGLMSFDWYSAMSRRLYLALHLEDAAEAHARSGARGVRQVLLDPRDCLETINEDFAEDSKGKSFVTEDDFYDCIFQLADLYTDGASAKLYAGWIEDHIKQIVKPFNGANAELLLTTMYEWKSDTEISSAVCSRLKVQVPVLSRLAWSAFFDSKLKREAGQNQVLIQAAIKQGRGQRGEDAATPPPRTRLRSCGSPACAQRTTVPGSTRRGSVDTSLPVRGEARRASVECRMRSASLSAAGRGPSESCKRKAKRAEKIKVMESTSEDAIPGTGKHALGASTAAMEPVIRVRIRPDGSSGRVRVQFMLSEDEQQANEAQIQESAASEEEAQKDDADELGRKAQEGLLGVDWHEGSATVSKGESPNEGVREGGLVEPRRAAKESSESALQGEGVVGEQRVVGEHGAIDEEGVIKVEGSVENRSESADEQIEEEGMVEEPSDALEVLGRRSVSMNSEAPLDAEWREERVRVYLLVCEEPPFTVQAAIRSEQEPAIPSPKQELPTGLTSKVSSRRRLSRLYAASNRSLQQGELQQASRRSLLDASLPTLPSSQNILPRGRWTPLTWDDLTPRLAHPTLSLVQTTLTDTCGVANIGRRPISVDEMLKPLPRQKMPQPAVLVGSASPTCAYAALKEFAACQRLEQLKPLREAPSIFRSQLNPIAQADIKGGQVTLPPRRQTSASAQSEMQPTCCPSQTSVDCSSSLRGEIVTSSSAVHVAAASRGRRIGQLSLNTTLNTRSAVKALHVDPSKAVVHHAHHVLYREQVLNSLLTRVSADRLHELHT